MGGFHDLRVLNERLLAYLMQDHAMVASENLQRAVALSPVCLATLKPTASEIQQTIAAEAPVSAENPLDIVYINKDFLNFARQVSRDVVSGGGFDGLVVLNINMAQARGLASLTNAAVLHLARRFPGPIFNFVSIVQRDWPRKNVAQNIVAHKAATLLAA